MLHVSNLEPPAISTTKFWEYTLPNTAIEKLIESEMDTYLYDQVIIDEAQDILKDNYLDFFDLSLKGGLASGKWIMFGDFEKQVIYERDQEIQKKLEERFRTIPRFSLRVNCRNTPRIVEYVHMLGGLTPKYSRIRRPDNNIEPKVVIYKSDQEQKMELEKILNRLVKARVAFSDVVILSTKKDENSITSLLSKEWKDYIIPVKQKYGKEAIGYSSVHAFKGLESPVVILTDVEQVSTANSAALFYIGITRALDQLFILVNEIARKEMLDLLAKDAI